MSDVLLQEHQQLKVQLRRFISQARENEQKMQRFQEQEMRLISSRSLAELLKNILFNYRSAFNLHAVSLFLYDPKYELQHFLEDDGNVLKQLPDLLFSAEKLELDSLFGHNNMPLLGAYDADFYGFLFRQPVSRLESVALLPLIRYGELIGSLNLASTARERFQHDTATDFLQRLATIVAICIENAANHERLKRVGLTDSLTGINNRRFFDQRIGEEIARSMRAREPIACLFLDIDHFKKINDNYGHHIGDQVLREVARIIREQLRNSDVLGRYGGEEFSALLANTTADTALEIAERIRSQVGAYRHQLDAVTNSKPIKVTISVGAAALDLSKFTPDIAIASKKLLEQSDKALYNAKNSGRDRVILFTDNEHQHQNAS